jgi:hypothetical protein
MFKMSDFKVPSDLETTPPEVCIKCKAFKTVGDKEWAYFYKIGRKCRCYLDDPIAARAYN